MSSMQPTDKPQTPDPDGQPKNLQRILLVEDDDALANVYVNRLQAEGFDVRRVGNGEDALATAISYKPNLVVLDVMMPKVSGFDVLDILRNTPETANLKVIMLTALSQPSDQERAKSLGADDYLVKSQVVIADVIDRIRHHLNEA
jgi:DNA-binding response OmpR family regulator